MARATKIYVVLIDQIGFEISDIRAAFTVKHEAMTWLSRQKIRWGHLTGWKLYSFNDGLHRDDKAGQFIGEVETLLAEHETEGF